NEADFATSFARNSSVAGHLTQSQLRDANYTLGASLYLFSNSAIIDRCSSGEAFCIFATAALWAASPFLICSMTCSRHFFPNSTNEFPVISTSHAPPSSLHVNFFILSSSFFSGIIYCDACSISRRHFSRAQRHRRAPHMRQRRFNQDRAHYRSCPLQSLCVFARNTREPQKFASRWKTGARGQARPATSQEAERSVPACPVRPNSGQVRMPAFISTRIRPSSNL